MLRYDAKWLLEQYADEPLAAPGIPYAPLGAEGPYQLAARACALSPRPVGRRPTASAVRRDGGPPGTLRSAYTWVQPCPYSDGVKSNYAMDGPGELRQTLYVQYGRRLPPLYDGRLSNGIGTAIVVFDRAGRPYLPRRAPGQSVFPGGYHCTASGEAVWREGSLEFDRLFTENICRELQEEVGITRADLEWIRPVAFCREFLRAGKPQFFFAARTLLGDSELRARRRAAIAAQLALGRQEVLDDALREFEPARCTIECVANVVLALR